MYDLLIFLALLALGYFFGRHAEKRHFVSIFSREKEYADLLTFCKRFPHSLTDNSQPVLVGGNVVVSIDYFKQVAAALRSLVGGRVTSYESLLDRARREAVLRMKADARRHGATTIVNVKLETASITKGQGQQVGCVEVYAYGTALVPQN